MLVPISIGLKCVIGSCVMSYLVVPSLYTCMPYFALSIPFARCSGMCSLLLVPLTPLISSGYVFVPRYLSIFSKYSFIGIVFCSDALFCPCWVHFFSSCNPHFGHFHFCFVGSPQFSHFGKIVCFWHFSQ